VRDGLHDLNTERAEGTGVEEKARLSVPEELGLNVAHQDQYQIASPRVSFSQPMASSWSLSAAMLSAESLGDIRLKMSAQFSIALL
jgi:hypothetical protein